MNEIRVAKELIGLAKKINVQDDYDIDLAKLRLVVDNFVRFLIGDPNTALAKLKSIGSPVGVPPTFSIDIVDDYNRKYGQLYKLFMASIKKVIG